MVTKRLLGSGLFLCCLTGPGFASADKGCFAAQGREDKQIHGYTLSVMPHPDQEKFQDECIGVIKGPGGNTVFSEGDHGMQILPISGRDINGDGQPDAVIEGYSGGVHCCWTYWIVSLGPSPGLLAKIENERGLGFQDLKNDGRIEMVTTDGGFDYFDDMCHACSPFPLVVLRLEGKQLHEVNAEFWSLYRRDIDEARRKLNPDALDRFRRNDRTDGNWEETKRLVLTIVLAYFYGGRAEQAWKTLEEMWPPSDLQRIRDLIIQKRGSGFIAEQEN